MIGVMDYMRGWKIMDNLQGNNSHRIAIKDISEYIMDEIGIIDWIEQTYKNEPPGGWDFPGDVWLGDYEISYLGLFYGEFFAGSFGLKNERKLYLEIKATRDKIVIPNDENNDPVLPKESPDSWHYRGKTLITLGVVFTQGFHLAVLME